MLDRTHGPVHNLLEHEHHSRTNQFFLTPQPSLKIIHFKSFFSMFLIKKNYLKLFTIFKILKDSCSIHQTAVLLGSLWFPDDEHLNLRTSGSGDRLNSFGPILKSDHRDF